MTDDKLATRVFIEDAITKFYRCLATSDAEGAILVLGEFNKQTKWIDRVGDDESKLRAADFLHESFYMLGMHPDKDELEKLAQVLARDHNEPISDARHRAMIMSAPSVWTEITLAAELAYVRKLKTLKKDMIDTAQAAGITL